MKKIFSLFGIFFILIFYTEAQDKQALDSLMNLYKNAKHDSIKILTLLELSSLYFEINSDTSITLTNKALEIGQKIKSKEYIVKALLSKGDIYITKDNYVTAYEMYQKALKINEETKSERNLVKCLNSIGYLYIQLYNYSLALNYLNQALKISEEVKDKESIISIIDDIGQLYIYQKKYDLAIKYYQKQLQINQEINSKKGIVGSLINLGDVYLELKEYKKSIDYFQKGFVIAETEHYYEEMFKCILYTGYDYANQGNYTLAMDYYQKCNALNNKFKENFLPIFVNLAIADCYQNLQNYDKGIEYALLGLQLAKKSSYQGLVNDFYKTIYKLYKSKKDYSKAIEYYEYHKNLSDSLVNSEKVAQISNLEIQEAINTKEQQIRKEKEARQLQNYIIYAFSVGFIIVLSLTYFVYRSRQKEKKAKELVFNQKEEISQINEELNNTLQIVEQERQKSEELLLNILPAEVAEELKEKGITEVRHFENTSVLFADVKGFSALASKVSPQELIKELDATFTKMDEIIAQYNLERIKTIGDCYMCAGGVPHRNTTNAVDITLAALAIQNWMYEEKLRRNGDFWQVRIGIHSGELVAGVIGKTKFAYDVWGNTVNTASRMESGGEVGKVNISETTYQLIKDFFDCTPRGAIEAKNIGFIETYFVDRIKPALSVDGRGFIPNEAFWNLKKEKFNEA